MNRAARRRAAKCKHPGLSVKRWADGREHRWCALCGFEEMDEPTTQEDTADA